MNRGPADFSFPEAMALRMSVGSTVCKNIYSKKAVVEGNASPLDLFVYFRNIVTSH